MDTDRAEFLAGARPDDVVIYVAEEAVDDPESLADHGETVSGGVVLTLDGEQGRSVFATATGTDPMAFARQASGVDGRVDRTLTGGTCPDEGDGGDHGVRFLFSFAERQKEDVEGIYAEGDVIHGYVQCDCGVTYSERWVVGDRGEGE
jgi:hypothetical protein